MRQHQRRARRPAAGVRVVLAAVLALPVLVGLASPSAADVSVDSERLAEQGGRAVLTFRVPTDALATTAIAVSLPAGSAGTPVDKPGWRGSGGSQTVTFTAVGVGIPRRGVDTFDVVVGPLPRARLVPFPVVQTFADGSTVSWSMPSAPGAARPPRPVPVLELVRGTAAPTSPVPAVTAGGTVTAPTAAAGGQPPESAAAVPQDSASPDDTSGASPGATSNATSNDTDGGESGLTPGRIATVAVFVLLVLGGVGLLLPKRQPKD